MAWDPFKDRGAIPDWDPFRDGGATPLDPEEEGLLGWAKDKAKRTGRGLAAAPGEALQMLGSAGDLIGRIVRTAGADEVHQLNGSTADERLAALKQARETPTPLAAAVEKTGRKAAQWGRDLYDGSPTFRPDRNRDEELTAKAADSVGSLATALATPGGVIAKATAGALINSQGQANEAREILKQRGATDAEADAEALDQFLLNLPAGGLEALPWGKAIKRFGGAKLADAVAEKYGKTALRRLTGAVFGQAASEGAEEGLQQLWGNAAAKATYDGDRKLTEGVGDAITVGGLMGGGLGGSLQLAAEGAKKLDTGKNVPESPATLAAQREQLLAGRKPAQMFPAGTEELPLPKGMGRVETERGVFHFNPQLTSADEILSASRAGRENEILGLGPVSKTEAERRAAAGDPLVAVAERTPDGTEVKTSAATAGTARAVAAALEQSKTPGNIVAAEPIDRSVRERSLVDELTATDDATAATAAAQRKAEEERRAAAQRDADAKKQAFAERLAAASQFARDPSATFAQIDGALKAISFYAEDNSLGLTQPQREQAGRAVTALEKRLAPLAAAEETRRETERKAAAEAALAEDVRRKTERKEAKAEHAAEVSAGLGADGKFDYTAAPLPALEARAALGDERAIDAIARREAQGEVESGGEELLTVLREIKLPNADAGLKSELADLIREGMTPRQRMTLVEAKAGSLDTVAEALRERGFAWAQTPADVIDGVQRALRGEKIHATRSGETGAGDAAFASGRDGQLADRWKEVAAHDGAFQFPTSTAKGPATIAREMSAPGMAITGEQRAPNQVVFRSERGGDLWITDQGKGWGIDALEAGGRRGEPRQQGAQLYQAALTWAHNNGAVIQTRALSPINELRRTSAMLSSALRHGTTDHMLPAAEQRVPWARGDHEANIASLARREAQLVQERLPATAEWRITPADGRISDSRNHPVSDADLARAIHAADGPARHGIGAATLRRALLTRGMDDAGDGLAARLREDDGARARAGTGILYADRAGRAGAANLAGDERSRLNPVATAQELAAIHATFPQLAKAFEIHIADVGEKLRAAGHRGKVPATARATILERAGQRALLVLGVRSYLNRAKGAGLLTHEIAHAFWNTLPPAAQERLRALWQHEIAAKTGPLFDAQGHLRSDLAVLPEHFSKERLATDPDLPLKEWFAERIARLNEQWARGRLDRTEQPLLARLAAQLREWLQHVWQRLHWRATGQSDPLLFVEDFRRFLLGGGEAQIGRKAGIAYAAEFASRPEQWPAVEAAARTLASRLRPAAGTAQAEAAAQHFLNHPLANRDTGGTATVSRASLRKMLSASAVMRSEAAAAHRLAVANVDYLFEIAMLRESRADRNEDPNIGALHHFESVLPLPEGPRRVRLLVKEYTDTSKGSRIYTLRTVEMVKPASYGEHANTGETGSTSSPPAGFEEKLKRLAAAVNAGPATAAPDFASGRDEAAARHAALDAERAQLKRELRALEDGPLGDAPREAAITARLAATEAEFLALDRAVRPAAYGATDTAATETQPRPQGEVGAQPAPAEAPPAPEVLALRERYAAQRDSFDRTTAEADALRAELAKLLDAEEAADFPRVRALRDMVREADAATRKLYTQLADLRGEIDRAEPTRAKLPEGKTAQQVMDELLRVENDPQPPRRDALIAEWRYGRQLLAEGKRTGNAAAQEEGKRLMAAASSRLNEEFPGWQAAREQAKPAPPPAAPEPAGIDDTEKSPFAEPPRDLPVRAGQIDTVYGHSAHTPSWLARKWETVRDVLRGWRGAVPELPAFPDAKWNRSDPFIRREGPRFYDRMKAFARALQAQNDHVQSTAAERVGHVTQELLDAGGKIDARGYARLAQLQEKSRGLKAEGRSLAAPLAAELAALQSRLEAHPYVLFERLVFMLDLRWRGQNLQDSAGKPILLPGGLNAAEIEAELQRLAQKIAASGHEPAIRRAAEAHRALVKQVADDLRSRELMAVEALQNPWYFPHLTLQTSRDGKVTERELRPARVRPGTEAEFRGYLVEPTGSVKPIETDYVRAMYYHLVQVGAHNAKADAVRFYARPYDAMERVRETAAKLSRERGQTVSWEQAFHEVYAPQGYVLYGADSGDAFAQVTVDRDKLAQRLGQMLTGSDLHQQLKELGLKSVTVLPEDLREVMQEGQRETWVVPARVGEALRGIAERTAARPGLLDATMKHAVGAWKAWKLFMPHNHVRYEYGNLVADLEKLVSAAPGTFRQMPQAARELRAFWLGGPPSDLLRAALKEGVINAVTAQEMNQLRASPLFRQFETGGEKAWAEFKAWASAPLANLTRLKGDGVLGRINSVEESAFREGLFRYAKFLADYKALQAGARPEYAGAAFREIDAMGDSDPGAGDAPVRKAAAISKATFGDYGDLSVTGSWLRDRLIPFYSWMEVNFRYHANLLRNLRDMVRAEEMSRAEAAKAGTRAAAVFAAGFSARAAGGIALRLALPYAAVLLWNSSGDRDELEKLLSEEDRRRFHIILGVVGDDAEAIDGTQIIRLGDGRKVRVAYANTALLDVLRWASGPAFAQQMARWLNGRTDFGTAAAAWRDQLAPDLLNNVVGSVGPVAKLPYAWLAKKNVFPDVLDQRSIAAHDLRRNILGQMTDEFTADLIERAVNKDYYAAKDLGTWASQLILQVRERDPESWAFYAIKDKAATFREKATGQRRRAGGGYDSDDQQVLRNFRRAIYRGDADNAVRFYVRLLDYGYTAEGFAASLRAQDPLADLPKENGLRRAFVESLDPTDREMLDRAYTYYGRMASSRGREQMLFPRQATGDRGLERYRANPQTDTLRRLMEAGSALTGENALHRAHQEERRSLQKR